MFLVPENAGNGIYTFKIFRGSMPPDPPSRLDPSLLDIHTLMLRPLQAIMIKLMLNLIVAMQSLVLEASNAIMVFLCQIC